MPRKREEEQEQTQIEFIPASEIPDRKAVPTGVPSIDNVMPFYLGTMYGFAGKPGMGKTRLSYQLAVSAIAHYGGNVLIYDFDRSLNKQLLLALGKRFNVPDILSRVYIPKYSLLQNQDFFLTIPSQVQYMITSHDVRAIVFDTITVARKMLWPGRENLAEAQQKIGSVINRVKAMLTDQIAILNIQVMQRPDQMGKVEYIGGPTVGHAVEMFMFKPSPQEENRRLLIAYEVSYLEGGLSTTFTICNEGIC